MRRRVVLSSGEEDRPGIGHIVMSLAGAEDIRQAIALTSSRWVQDLMAAGPSVAAEKQPEEPHARAAMPIAEKNA